MITFLQGVCVRVISAVLHDLCRPIGIVESALRYCFRAKNDAIVRKCCSNAEICPVHKLILMSSVSHDSEIDLFSLFTVLYCRALVVIVCF